MGGARQVGNFFVASPHHTWHPRGWRNEGWPAEELGWAIFESVSDDPDSLERYYDMKHSVQCKTRKEAEDLLAAIQLVLEEMTEDEENCNA